MTMRLALPPVEIISERANEISPGKLLVGLFLGIFLVVGWLAAKIWLTLKLILASVEMGWQRGIVQSSDSS